MNITADEKLDWIERGKKQGATHLVIVCDTFDYEHYPVFVKPTDDVDMVRIHYNQKEMQKVMEIIPLPVNKTGWQKLTESNKPDAYDKLYLTIQENESIIKDVYYGYFTSDNRVFVLIKNDWKQLSDSFNVIAYYIEPNVYEG